MSTVNYTRYLNDLYNLTSTPIKVSTSFHGQMAQINKLFKNDKTALISSLTEYMVHSATVPMSFDADNSNTNKAITNWQQNVNQGLSVDIPRGLRSFTEQFFRERWKSSFIVVKLLWEEVDGYWLPTKMYVMDGSSIYVKKEGHAINGCKYYLGNPDKAKDKGTPLRENSTTSIIVRKPFNQLYEQYPTPYLIRKGALYHALFKFKVLDRQAEIIETAFPYQLMLSVGTQDAIKRGHGPDAEALEKIKEKFQNQKKEYDEHTHAKGLATVLAGDVTINELIPDYKKATDEAILKPVDKNILYALGMIEFKGISSNREEAILNPKVLIEEVEDGVKDYVDVMSEIMLQIQERNKGDNKIDVQAGIIKTFLTDNMKTLIRSWYDRGVVGYKSGLENTTGLKFKTQVKERKDENEDELDKLCEPRKTQNNEKDSDNNGDNITDDKKPGSPEVKNYKDQ